MNAEIPMLVGAGLVIAGVAASVMASRLGVPALLMFLGLGMVAGAEGPGGVAFDDFELARAVGVSALALILFDGGLSTRWETVRPVAGPSLLLATLGVVVTAGITGVAAAWVLDVPIEVGLLLGAIVSSTDAAAVFSVLRSRSTGLRDDVQATLEFESGANDPMAVFLTIALVEVVTGGGDDWMSQLPVLAVQFVVGACAGALAGWTLVQVLNRLDLRIAGLYPVLTLAAAVGTYAGTTLLGGSGFLAAYLCGLVVGNLHVRHRTSVQRFHDAVAWLAQIGMFLVLGLLVFPSRLLDVAPQAVLLVAVLVFVARPVAVFALLTPFRIRFREQAVIGWMGLRGATPIILATFPLVEEVPQADLLFDVVFFVVLLSVLVQATTLGTVARALRATVPFSNRAPAPFEPGAPLPDGTALRSLTIPAGSPVAGRTVVQLDLAPGCLLVLVDRAGVYVVPTGSTRLDAGDVVTLLADEASFRRLEREVSGLADGPPRVDGPSDPGRDGDAP